MVCIVAFDASTESKESLKLALEQAEEKDEHVEVIYSVRKQVENEASTGTLIIESMDKAESRAESVLSEAEQIAGEFDASVTTLTKYGNPSETIIDHVNGTNEAMIFVGHRQHASDISAVGSTAQALISKSPVPVTVVSG